MISTTRRLPSTEPASNRISEDRISEEQAQFYLKLILYSTMFPFTAKHSERDVSADISRDHTELRRDFLDKMSYLCDIQKSGPTVTAAALQKKRGSIILWLAANEGIRPEVKAFVDLTMDRLRAVNPETSTQTGTAILQDALGKGEQRFSFYLNKMVISARECRDRLDRLKDDKAGKCCTWREPIVYC